MLSIVHWLRTKKCLPSANFSCVHSDGKMATRQSGLNLYLKQTEWSKPNAMVQTSLALLSFPPSSNCREWVNEDRYPDSWAHHLCFFSWTQETRKIQYCPLSFVQNMLRNMSHVARNCVQQILNHFPDFVEAAERQIGGWSISWHNTLSRCFTFHPCRARYFDAVLPKMKILFAHHVKRIWQGRQTVHIMASAWHGQLDMAACYTKGICCDSGWPEASHFLNDAINAIWFSGTQIYIYIYIYIYLFIYIYVYWVCVSTSPKNIKEMLQNPWRGFFFCFAGCFGHAGTGHLFNLAGRNTKQNISDHPLTKFSLQREPRSF